MVDVAREARVALSTVSRVVNGDPTVGPDFVERVQAAIASLGYRPDEQAQHLRRGHSKTIGVAVRKLANPVLDAFEPAARQAGFSVLAASTAEDEDQEREVVLSMARRSFDGVVLEPIGDEHGYVAREIAHGLAMVAIDRPVAGAEVDAVLSDNATGIRMAYQHLTAYGHRRIAYLGDHERIFTGSERANAFRECLSADGHSADGLVHTGWVEQADVERLLAKLLAAPNGPTAIISGNVFTTLAILDHLPAKTSPASRPALVGFDDFPLARLLKPGLTVVAQDTRTMAHAALRLLTSRIAQPEREVEQLTIPVSLVPRGSGEVPPPDARERR